MNSQNDRFFDSNDKAIVKCFKIDPSIRKLVDFWITTILNNRISLVDFGVAAKLVLYFLKNKSRYDEYKLLKKTYA